MILTHGDVILRGSYILGEIIMRESALLGFDQRYFKVYRLSGLAKLLAVEDTLIAAWLSKYVSTSFRRKTMQGMASTFYCDQFEFAAQDQVVYDPRRSGVITSRWHLFHFHSRLTAPENFDAYGGNLHVDWTDDQGTVSIENIELCVVRNLEKPLVAAARKTLVQVKLAH